MGTYHSYRTMDKHHHGITVNSRRFRLPRHNNGLCQQQAVLDLKITDFWDVTWYSFVQTQQHFQETSCPHLQVEWLKFCYPEDAGSRSVWNAGIFLPDCVLFRLHTHCCEDLKPCCVPPLSRSSELTPHRTASVSALRILCCVSCISVRFQTEYMSPSIFVRFWTLYNWTFPCH
jgi:hypothetical protein